MGGVRFANRHAAGEALARAVREQRLPAGTAVLGVPRGGLVVAAPLARALGGPLLPALVQKLGVPWQPEAAYGALDADGHAVTDAALVAEAAIGVRQTERVSGAAGRELERRRRAYPAPPIADYVPGRCAVIVDDGLATGYTMLAAVRFVRRRVPARLIVAAPCASSSAVELLASEADAVVTLETSDDFVAVGNYYDDFAQTSDEEVQALLEEINAPFTPRNAGERR
jgi:predicted phosphoribosyltransferase